MQVQLLTTPGCAGCEKVKRMLEQLGIVYEVIDVTENPDQLSEYQIYVAPGVIIDGKLAFMGVPKEKDLLERLGRFQP